MNDVRLLAIAGSTRRQSFNRQVLRIASEAAAAAGAEVTTVDLTDYALPLFDQDLEQSGGTPHAAKALKRLFVKNHGLLIASPEYNSSIPPLLKNMLDWVSRSDDEHPPLAAFRNKVAAVMSASPGNLGGLRGLVHLRAILGNIGVVVLPEQWAIARAGDAFDESGDLKDAALQAGVAGLGCGLTDFLRRLNAAGG